MNTLFRLATVIVLLPCIGLMEHMVELLFPDDGSAAEEQEMDRLEERFCSTRRCPSSRAGW